MTHAPEYASQFYLIFNVDMRSQVQINLYNGEHLQIRGWTVYPLSYTCVVLYNFSHDLLLYWIRNPWRARRQCARDYAIRGFTE